MNTYKRCIAVCLVRLLFNVITFIVIMDGVKLKLFLRFVDYEQPLNVVEYFIHFYLGILCTFNMTKCCCLLQK